MSQENEFYSIIDTQEQIRVLLYELKSPIAVALSCMQMIQQKVKDKHEQDYITEYKDFFDLAARNICRSLRATNNVLDSLRFQENTIDVTPRQIDLVGLVSAFCTCSAPYAAMHGMRIEFESACDTLDAVCDQTMIGRVVMNLLGNALKAVTPPDGTVLVHLSQQENNAVLVVQDNGNGLTPEQQAHMFEKKWQESTSNPECGGIELGLYIAQNFVRLHHGTIEVENCPEQGARFVVTLPLQPNFMATGANVLASVGTAYETNWIEQQVHIELLGCEL